MSGIDAKVDLAPLAALGRAVFARAPFSIAHSLDAGAVDQQVQRSRTGTAGNFNEQALLPPAQRTEVRHRPIKPGHLQQARDHAGGLTQGQLEQRFERQANLNRRIREDGLTSALAGRRGQPLHPRIKPNLQRTSLRQRCVYVFQFVVR